MIFTGFTDEVSLSLDSQIDACKTLGWSHIDLRSVGDKNICHLEDHEFDMVLKTLNEADLKILCFGSPIANWSRTTDYPLHDEIRELQHAARLMRKSGVSYIRIMSYALDSPSLVSDSTGIKIAQRLQTLTKTAEDEGIILLHENCETWGGQSSSHTEFLLEKINSPSFKLIFDTGNPPATKNITGLPPYNYQNGFDFLKCVFDEVELIHIKDAGIEDSEVSYTWPGEGNGHLEEIIRYLYDRGFNGPLSIEPHLSVIYHDPSVHSTEKQCRDTFIEYANRAKKMVRKAGFIL